GSARRRGGAPAHRPERAAAAGRLAHPRVRQRRRAVRLHAAPRRRLVSLLRRPPAQALGLLWLPLAAHQRRRRADGLLLPRAQGVLRHLFPDARPVLIVLALAALAAGATGSWSPCGFSMIDTLGGRGRATAPAFAAFALGDPALGVAVGVAFGAGRALPVVVLAPLAGREAGARAMTAMAERPAVLRAARAAGAAALLLCAALLAAAPARAAARPVVVVS